MKCLKHTDYKNQLTASTVLFEYAYGFDRMIMLMVGADSIRDVIAFPKVKDASCLMTKAPTPVDPKQLEDLGIEVIPEEKEE